MLRSGLLAKFDIPLDPPICRRVLQAVVGGEWVSGCNEIIATIHDVHPVARRLLRATRGDRGFAAGVNANVVL